MKSSLFIKERIEQFTKQRIHFRVIMTKLFPRIHRIMYAICFLRIPVTIEIRLHTFSKIFLLIRHGIRICPKAFRLGTIIKPLQTVVEPRDRTA